MEKIDIQDFVCFYENANYRLWNPLQNAKPEIKVNFEAGYAVLLFKITVGWLAVGFFKGWIEVSNSIWGAASVGNSDAASCKIFRISKCVYRSKQEL